MRRLSKFAVTAALCTQLVSCATWDGMSPMVKKYSSFVGCALIGGAVAQGMVKDAASPQTTTSLNALGAGTLCYMGVDQYYSAQTDAKITDQDRREGVLTKSMERSGRFVFDYSTGDTVFGPTRIHAKCQGKTAEETGSGMLCTAADGSFGDCSSNGFVYVGPNWAFQIAAFYSEDGCFDGPYTEPKLKPFADSLIERNKK